MRNSYPIQLEDLFKKTKGKRKVILFEGAPGCGKSIFYGSIMEGCMDFALVQLLAENLTIT